MATTAAPILALLDEPNYDLKTHALESLDENITQLWAEVSDHVSQIEELYEDKDFPRPELAALVASKIYYNLGDYESSMKFALAAGKLFNFDSSSDYVETIVSKCIREYIEVSQQHYEDPAAPVPDARLGAVLDQMLQRSYAQGHLKLALGVALEARRLDIITKILETADPEATAELVHYVLDCVVTVVSSRRFKDEVLLELNNLIQASPQPDYHAICKIIVQLNSSEGASRLFKSLLASKDPDSTLIAYQCAFDLVASGSQQLLNEVAAEFKDHETLAKILSGVPTCDYDLTFLNQNNNTDTQMLNRTKNSLDPKSSMNHSAVTFANAFLHAGTAQDSFIRSNLDWLSKASNWTKLSATAALGVIHKGNLSQGRRILAPYLPQGDNAASGSPYTRGGSLYALGLIFAGHGNEVLDYLQEQIENTASDDGGDVVLHGACLGIGVAGMGSGKASLYDKLRDVLFSDSAVAGEAAGLAMGLVMLGSADEDAQKEMFLYAHETQHEKIIRGLALGLALVNYAREESAEPMIEQLLAEQDPILRYGGAYTIALAYAGTGNNKAIQRLLHIAVSDASDDVRRAAVISLGFILLRNYTAVPRMVELLSESHNPHVRYGTALALGISCAGTGLKEAVEVLEPLTKDPADFVRQGALVALSMILIQQNEKMSPRVKSARETFAHAIASKHEDPMVKFGAALAQGIIDAGGRNVTIALENPQTGSLNMKAIVGLVVFSQFWYWFPYTHFLSLSFSTTAVTGVNEDLKIPQFDFVTSHKPSFYGYPPPAEEVVDKAPEKVATAVLSTTARAKARAKKNEKDKADKMEVEEKPEEPSTATAASAKPAKEAKVDEDADKRIPGQKKWRLANLTRVLPAQLKHISFPEENRFVPIRKLHSVGGVVVLRDQEKGKGGKKPQFIKTVRQINNPFDDEDDEAPLPEPFKYVEEDTE